MSIIIWFQKPCKSQNRTYNIYYIDSFFTIFTSNFYLKKGNIMYEDFFSDRIAELRIQKNVSAREMSLALGQNESYINRIENQRSFPSMQVFFYICEYLNVTPKEFFTEKEPCEEPQETTLSEDFDKLTPYQNNLISSLVKELIKK